MLDGVAVDMINTEVEELENRSAAISEKGRGKAGRTGIQLSQLHSIPPSFSHDVQDQMSAGRSAGRSINLIGLNVLSARRPATGPSVTMINPGMTRKWYESPD